MEKKYVSIGTAAKLLCVHPDTIRAWIDAGILKGYTTPTKHRKVLAEDIERILNGEEVSDETQTR